MRMLLEFRNLTVYRDETRVLDRFSLTIPARQNIAILGPNGSGKSTLIKLVTRELYPVVTADAEIRVLGRNRWVLSELREHLGIVSNDLMATCTREITGRELVLSAFFGSVGLWPYHEVTLDLEARAQIALEMMEVTHLADRVMTQLSSGEARRLLVARALAHSPDALGTRRADEQPRSASVPRFHGESATACATGHEHHPGDAPPARHHSGDRSRRCAEGRSSAARRTQGGSTDVGRFVRRLRRCGGCRRARRVLWRLVTGRIGSDRIDVEAGLQPRRHSYPISFISASVN